MTATLRVDAAHAAAVLSANGSTLPPGITDAAGYRAYLHPDPHDALTCWRQLTEPYGVTLIAIDTIEGGILTLYVTHETLARARLNPTEET
jgi:hypothetical protein